MDTKILDNAKELLGSGFAAVSANKLGENTSGIESAVGAIVPTIFGGIAHKVSNDPSFLSTVISEAKNVFTNHSLSDLGNFVNADSKGTEGTQAGSFLFDVFGGRMHGLVEKIASFAGIKTGSVRQLFDVASIASLGSIGKNLVEENGSAQSIGSFLSNQKAAFLSAIPASLGFGSLFSGAHTSSESTTSEAAHVTHSDASYHTPNLTDKAKGNNRFFVPAILTIIGLGLLIWLFKGCWGNEKQHDGIVAQDTTAVVAPVTDNSAATTAAGKLDSTSGNYIYNTGSLISIKLPNNTTVDSVGENSTENKLFTFLNDSTAQVDTLDKTKGWISFDRLYFKTSSSELTTDSRKQLTNIATILKAFPHATIKLGGYTDSTGNAASNVSLSDQRAKVARTQLVADGVDGASVAAAGYGKDHPIATNETAEGRAQNRRIDVRVTKK